MNLRARFVLSLASGPLLVASVSLGCQTVPAFALDDAEPADAVADSRADADEASRDATVTADVTDGGTADVAGDVEEDVGTAIVDGGPPPPEWDGSFVCEAPDAAVDAAADSRFCAIYRDMLAPVGAARCQSSGCHGGPIGVQKLAMGWTGKECYDAITTKVVPWLTPTRLVQPVPGGDSRPVSLMPKIVNANADAGLLMPLPLPDAGNRLLTAGERARLDAWLSRGAPFD